MNALNDESVQFKAGWNAASQGRELRPGASEEAEAGFNAYLLGLRPLVPKRCRGRGHLSENSKKTLNS